MSDRLTIFMPHCSDLLTDHLPHGDGLVANGFVRRLAARGHRLIAAAPEAQLKEPMPDNVELHVLGREGKLPLVRRLSYMRRVRALYKEVRCSTSINVLHQLNPVYTGLSLALADAPEPLILGPYISRWPTDPDAVDSPFPAMKRVLGEARRVIAGVQQARADAILLTTPAARERLPHAERHRAKIRILPHGIDTDFFRPREASEAGEPAPTLQVLFFSNIHKRKGIFDLLLAFEKVYCQCPQAELVVAGAGEDLRRAQEVAETLNARARIRFLGSQSRDQSVQLLQRCTVFCLPSHGEPFGMAAAEAMSCGKPVIATRTGGLGYLVPPDAGLQVPDCDPDALAAALTHLLSAPALRSEMGAAARRHMLAHLAWDRVIDGLESTYRSAMTEKSTYVATNQVANPAQNLTEEGHPSC